jgi:hypothetical protein
MRVTCEKNALEVIRRSARSEAIPTIDILKGALHDFPEKAPMSIVTRAMIPQTTSKAILLESASHPVKGSENNEIKNRNVIVLIYKNVLLIMWWVIIIGNYR